MGRFSRLVGISALVVGMLAGAGPVSATDSGDGLAPLRSVYLRAVCERPAVDHGLRMIDSLRTARPDDEGAWLNAVLTGYQGALITLRAKHALWPGTKLAHLREGLRIMDAVVRAHPELAEVRYLRLMSCFYLPSILGRNGSVREDFAALARLLPRVRAEYPPELYAVIVRFVLEEGDLADDQRRPLLRAMASAHE